MTSCSGHTQVEGDSSLVNSSSNPDYHNMDWLTGSWVGTTGTTESSVYEKWTESSEKRYIGLGMTLVKGDTISQERMEIAFSDGHHCLVVEHDDAERVIFEFIKEGDQSFTCENQENDFPKRIEYKREGEELVAIISGGGPSMEFRFKKW